MTKTPCSTVENSVVCVPRTPPRWPQLTLPLKNDLLPLEIFVPWCLQLLQVAWKSLPCWINANKWKMRNKKGLTRVMIFGRDL
jgi:hypothetical protein